MANFTINSLSASTPAATDVFLKSDSSGALTKVPMSTLEDKIVTDKAVNNTTTNQEGFVLDARQANPSIPGSLASLLPSYNENNGIHVHCIVNTSVTFTNGEARVDLSNYGANFYLWSIACFTTLVAAWITAASIINNNTVLLKARDANGLYSGTGSVNIMVLSR